MARMNWLRLYNETPTDLKIRMVAKETGQTVANVLAVWVMILCHSSAIEGERRGTLDGWHDALAGMALDLPRNVVQAIRQGMEGLLLQGDRIIAWQARQMPSDSSAARVKAHRERRRAAAARSEASQDVTGGETLHVTPGNGVTRRGEERREEEKRRESPGGDSHTPPSPAPAAAGAGAPGPAALPPASAKPAPRKRVAPEAEPAGFAAFWQAYPNGAKKQDARKAYAKALGTGMAPDHLLVAVKAYPFDLRDDGRFVPHASTWLNGRRWEDEPRRGAPVASAAATAGDQAREILRQRHGADLFGGNASPPSGLFDHAGPMLDGHAE